MSVLLRAFGLAYVTCVCLQAQTSSARVTGTITDPTGAAVPQARVTLRNQSTGISTSAETNATGIYTLSFLQPGPYDLTIEGNGFKRYTRQVTLETGQVLPIDAVLQLGDVSESVSVTTETPLLQAETSSLNQLIENATIKNMPLASRRIGSLIRLMGNVSFQGEASWEGIVNFSIAGGRGRQQIWQLDGGNLQGVTLVTGITSVAPPVEAMQEFRVEANGYPAEFGRTMGGFVSMTTKSGTNQFHGALYEFLRNNAMDARNFFSPGEAPRRYNVFGATIGGPVIRDRTHFFFSYEGTRRRDGVTRILNVPSVEQTRGDFSTTAGSLIDPLSRQPFAGNRIPTSRLDPVGAKLAQLWPAPNVPGAAVGNRNFATNSVDKVRGDNFILRADHVIGPKDRIYGRYLKFRSPVEQGRVYPNPAADSTINQLSDQFHITTNWLHSFRGTLLNELRYNYNRRTNEDPSLFPSTIAGDAGLRGIAQDGTPTISVTGFTGIGPGNQYRFAGPGFQHQIIDSVSWFRGKHQFKFGGEWRSSQLTDIWGTSRSGSFAFNDVATGRGFGVAALLLGWPTTVSVDTGDTTTVSNYFALFLQDDWKLTSRLTLNYGLRWEMDTPRTEKDNKQTGVNLFALNPISGTPGIITYAGRDGVGRHAHAFDKNNIGPRFGFAYRPIGDKLVLRGGYGLMYGPIYDDSISRANVVGFGDVRQFQSSDNGLTPPFLLKDGVPTPPTEPLGPGFGAVRVGERVRISPDFYMPDHRATYAHHLNFGIQRQMLGSLLLEASYTSNLAHRVSGRPINVNEIRPELWGRVQDQRLRPFPQYGNVTWRATNWGNSSYHGFNAKVEKRFSRGLNLLSNYTWSKFIDDVEAAAEVGGAPGSGQQTYYARHLDKSLSGNDIRHRWVSSAVYELPIGKGRLMNLNSKAADLLAGGWSLGLISELRTGLPYGVVEQTNRLNSFSAAQRSSIVSDPQLPTGRSRADLIRSYFNPAAFAFPGDGVLGTAGRANGTGPGAFTMDVSLLKDFHFTEQRYLQLRGEFFSVLNQPNFGLPNTSRGSAAFGTIGSAGGARQIQVGLRFVY
ncbi:MAG: TonB-dependent receptor [Acidobacteria bacterium]|nr:TonB-dependent receptor [Acidobacteriota bacterium]